MLHSAEASGLSRDERGVRDVIDAWAAALRAKEATGVMATQTTDIALFTLAPPLVTPPEGASGLQAWFDTWDGPLEVEFRDLNVVAGPDVAYGHCLMLLGGTLKDGGPSRIWLRLTIGLRKARGRWTICHTHESVPFYMDGSYRAAVDLAPQDRLP